MKEIIVEYGGILLDVLVGIVMLIILASIIYIFATSGKIYFESLI